MNLDAEHYETVRILWTDNNDEALNCRECGTEFERPNGVPVHEESKNLDFPLSELLSKTSGPLKSVASLSVDSAIGLFNRLKEEGIPAEAQRVTREEGLEYCDIVVEDCNYERACDVAEAWEAEQLVEAERRSSRHCPACGSSHWEYTDADSFGMSVWKCKDCGNCFAR